MVKVRSRSKPRRRRRSKRYIVDYKRLALSLLLFALSVEVVLMLLTSPWFYITRVKVEGTKVIAKADLQKIVKVPKHSNLFCFRTKSIERALRRNPVVKSVSISKRPPHTLRIRIVERRAHHVLASGGKLHEIDRDAVPFRIVPQPPGKVPVISCGLGRKVVLGRRLASPRYLAARECLLEAQSKKNFATAKISVDQNGDLCLNTRDGLEVRLGQPSRLSDKLNRVVRFATQMPQVYQNAEYINVTCPDAPAYKLRGKP